jgi:hypothetical protein
MGRPVGLDSERRRREFLRLLASGETLKKACKDSGMSCDALVTLLDEDEFWTVAKALREGRAEIAAVTVAPGVEARAA